MAFMELCVKTPQSLMHPGDIQKHFNVFHRAVERYVSFCDHYEMQVYSLFCTRLVFNIEHNQQSTNLYHNSNMTTDSSDDSVERNRQADRDDPSLPSSHRRGQFKDILYDTDDDIQPATRQRLSYRRGQLKDPVNDTEDDSEPGPTIDSPAKQRTTSQRRGQLKDPVDDAEDDSEPAPTIDSPAKQQTTSQRRGQLKDPVDDADDDTASAPTIVTPARPHA
jgi:hypothetical protein